MIFLSSVYEGLYSGREVCSRRTDGSIYCSEGKHIDYEIIGVYCIDPANVLHGYKAHPHTLSDISV